MVRFMKSVKKIIIYGLLIPIAVILLADLAIDILSKFYWGKQIVFKLKVWYITLSITLSIIYYLFYFLFSILKKTAGKRLLTVLFIISPY